VRYLFTFLCVLSVALFGGLAASSCVLDYRDAEAGMDGEAGPMEVAMVDAALEADVGDAGDVDLDCGCCSRQVLPPGSPLFCMGKMGFPVYPSYCSLPCPGAAYALCVNGCYSSCVCEPPSDYAIFDAGLFGGEVPDVTGAP
jgi:hypothetical protein